MKAQRLGMHTRSLNLILPMKYVAKVPLFPSQYFACGGQLCTSLGHALHLGSSQADKIS
jgi:hypothetical protein